MNANPGISGSGPQANSSSEPYVYREAIVQCEGYRCLAYVDKDGIWKNHSNSARIAGQVVVLEWLN